MQGSSVKFSRRRSTQHAEDDYDLEGYLSIRDSALEKFLIDIVFMQLVRGKVVTNGGICERLQSHQHSVMLLYQE